MLGDGADDEVLVGELGGECLDGGVVVLEEEEVDQVDADECEHAEDEGEVD